MCSRSLARSQHQFVWVVGSVLLVGVTGCAKPYDPFIRSKDHYYRYRVDALPSNLTISVRRPRTFDDPSLRKKLGPYELFLEEFAQALSASRIFAEVTLIDREEKTETDLLLAMEFVNFGGSGMDKVLWGCPRYLAVHGALVDVRHKSEMSEMMSFKQSVQRAPYLGWSTSEDLDRKLAQLMSEDIINSLRSRMSPPQR